MVARARSTPRANTRNTIARPGATKRAPARRVNRPAAKAAVRIVTRQLRAPARRMAVRKAPMNRPKGMKGTTISLSAFSELPVPRPVSEARSMLCKGGTSHQFGTSYGQLVTTTTLAIADYAPAFGPLPQAAITAAEPYPTTLVFMPSNGPVLFRVYCPVILETSTPNGRVYTVIGLASEDYGAKALGTSADYAVAVQNKTPQSITALDGKIIDLSTATHSFRIRNVTPAIATGGTVRLLRQATGVECPILAATAAVMLYSGGAYYRKAVACDFATPDGIKDFSGTVALMKFAHMLENLANSNNYVACNGKQFTEPHEGSCTVVDQIKAAEYRREGLISDNARTALKSVYGSALPGYSAAIAVDIAMPLISVRAELLAATPPPAPPSYALTWSQGELRTNMLTGQAFPLDPWPNFGNIGYTQDPLALIGLKMRFPASGGDTYVVAHVDPASPLDSGLIFFNPPTTSPASDPEPLLDPTTGFSPVGAGWEDIDVQNLLTTEPKALTGLRFRDNVSSTVYIILRASKSAIEAVVDGPDIATPPQTLTPDEADFDPFSADLIEPRFTPFFVVFEAIPGASGSDTGAAYVNTYEITARSQQFAHFSPGSLLANNQRPQPSAPLALRKAKDAEERKGSWLSKVTHNVFRAAANAGQFAYNHRTELGAIARTVM